MSREEVYDKLREVFCDVFDEETVTIADETTAADIEGWDSLTHITLIGTIEDEFEVEFSMKDIVKLKNVGEMVDLILEQVD